MHGLVVGARCSELEGCIFESSTPHHFFAGQRRSAIGWGPVRQRARRAHVLRGSALGGGATEQRTRHGQGQTRHTKYYSHLNVVEILDRHYR